MRRLRRHPRHRVAMRKVWGSSLLSLSACSKKPRTASLIWKWSVKRRRRVLWVVLGGALSGVFHWQHYNRCEQRAVGHYGSSQVYWFFLTGGLASRHYPDSSFIVPLILKRVFFSSLKKFFFRVFVDRKLANHCISYALSIYRVFNAKSGLIELH